MRNEPRLAPTTPQDWDDETTALLGSVGRLNIFTTLAHHPKLLKRWLVFGSHVLSKSTLPPRAREILILRTGWRCRCEYEFGQHRIIGEQAGLTADEIGRLMVDRVDGWSTADATLVTAADELVSGQRLTDSTWAALTERWSTEQVIDLVFAVGQYVLVCMALNSFEVERDPGVPGWAP